VLGVVDARVTEFEDRHPRNVAGMIGGLISGGCRINRVEEEVGGCEESVSLGGGGWELRSSLVWW
jgi:hypothetical protein